MFIEKIKKYHEDRVWLKKWRQRDKIYDEARPIIEEIKSELTAEHIEEMRALKRNYQSGHALYGEPTEITLESIDDEIKNDPELLSALSVVSERFRLVQDRADNIPPEDLLCVLFAVYRAAGDELAALYSGTTIPPSRWRTQRKIMARINFDKEDKDSFYHDAKIILFCG